MRFWLAGAYLPPQELLDIARAADECGFEGITLSDHLLYPRELRSAYPYAPDGRPPFGPDTPWPDPWVAIAAMAAVTARLRFTTNVYVAPARDLLTVAKAVSTAAVLSGGRVAAGFAAGWMREEFDATGQDFEGRGRRLDEMIPALRSLWAGEWTEVEGVGEVRISPVPTEPIPIYVGGESPAALRRAASLGDGWVANAQTVDLAEHYLERLRALRLEIGRERVDSEAIIPLMALPDDAIYEHLSSKGLTGVIVAPWIGQESNPSVESRIEALRRFSSRYIGGSD